MHNNALNVQTPYQSSVASAGPLAFIVKRQNRRQNDYGIFAA